MQSNHTLLKSRQNISLDFHISLTLPCIWLRALKLFYCLICIVIPRIISNTFYEWFAVFCFTSKNLLEFPYFFDISFYQAACVQVIFYYILIFYFSLKAILAPSLDMDKSFDTGILMTISFNKTILCWHVRPAKTQISRRISAGWSEPLLGALRIFNEPTPFLCWQQRLIKLCE